MVKTWSETGWFDPNAQIRMPKKVQWHSEGRKMNKL